jgi:hypothetical protein
MRKENSNKQNEYDELEHDTTSNLISTPEECYYEVEKIVNKKLGPNGRIFYLVKWVGYTEDEMTWEPIENLETVRYLVEKFDHEVENANNMEINSENMDHIDNIDNPLLSANLINEMLGDENENEDIVEVERTGIIKKAGRVISNSTNYTNKFIDENTNIVSARPFIDSEIYDSNADYANFLFADNNLSNSSSPKKRTRNRKKAKNSSSNPKKAKGHQQKKKNENLKNLTNSKISTNGLLSKSKRKTDTPIEINYDEYLKGNIHYDIPKSINLAKIMKGKLHFLVSWEPRSDGTVPDDELVPHHLVKEKYPYVLLDFYEERLRFGNTKISPTHPVIENKQDTLLDQLNFQNNMSNNNNVFNPISTSSTSNDNLVAEMGIDN